MFEIGTRVQSRFAGSGVVVSGVVDDDDGVKSQTVQFDNSLIGERIYPIMKLDYEEIEPQIQHPRKPRPARVLGNDFLTPFRADPRREPFREWLMSLPKTDVSFQIEGTVDSVEEFYSDYVALTGEVLPESSKHVQPNKWGLELRVQFPNPPEGLPLPDERKKTRDGYEELTPRQVTDTRKEWACNDLVKYLFKGGFRPRGINASQT